ncbi:MAG: hypothetical protein JXM79_08570 [Sedimentisphaerales bacterium]|nr:hypothetical protein [Sedimentisphaerales bacterium]
MMIDKINFNHIQLVIVLAISISLCLLCNAKIIYVDADAVGANNGSRWADAYNYLQDAIADADTTEEPVEILVAQGVYRPDQGGGIISGDRSATFRLLNGVGIYGGYAGFGEQDPNARDVELYETILSGDLNADDTFVETAEDLINEPDRGENAYQVVNANDTDETAILDGFTITGGNADIFTNRDGGGLVNDFGSPRIINCTFIENSARYFGGGIYNYYSSPTLIECTFIRNAAQDDGGGIYSYRSDPNLVNCTFIENWARGSGGGMHTGFGSPSLRDCAFTENVSNQGGAMYTNDSSISLIDCTFEANRALDKGGGIYSFENNPVLTRCIFNENTADYGGGGVVFHSSDPSLIHCQFNENSSYYGGGIYNTGYPRLESCLFRGNVGRDYGGAMYNSGGDFTFTNCIFNANRANSYGGALSCNNSNGEVMNCTFRVNSWPDGNAIACNSQNQRAQSRITIVNSILWEDNPIWINDRSTVDISYSNISGGWPGEGNIDVDSFFEYAEGPDGVSGTDDDDLRLSPLSECVDAGNPTSTFCPDETDADGNPRVIGDRVDIGAYEFQGILYVDDDTSDAGWKSQERAGSEYFPFRTIQEAINIAKDGYTVIVQSGVYDKIDFLGKPITVKGADGSAVIEAPSPDGREGEGQDAVTFHTGEGPESVLKNFIIKNSGMAISLNSRSQPTITNLTIVDNDFGIAAYENSSPDIRNCILWNNTNGNLFQCEVRYSCIEDGAPGEGNISVDPLFVDTDNGDYHLKSEGWRWSIYEQTWTYDEVTSPCIDAGEPASSLGDELMSVPRDPNNQFGLNRRINMGAFGGTWQASMPPIYWGIPEYETEGSDELP